jgi:hypothetical protein
MPRELRIEGPDRFDPVAVGDRIKLEVRVTEDGVAQANVPVFFSCPTGNRVTIGTKPSARSVTTGDDGTATAVITIQPGAAGDAFQVKAHIFTGNGSDTETVWFSVVVNP